MGETYRRVTGILTMDLAEQLQRSKQSLKKSSEKMKDFSSPKTAGFITPEEIRRYENSVLDVNTERWLTHLSDVTFPTVTCPFTMEDAKLFLEIYERLYLNKSSEASIGLNWRKEITDKEHRHIEDMKKRLDKAMEIFTADGSAFVKLSSRSAKDAPLIHERFKHLYKSKLAKYSEDEQSQENTIITCLLQAAFDAMRVKTGDDVIDMFIRSERVYQDLLLAAVNRPEMYHEHFIIRKFIPIDVDMEFRGFVYQGKLNALSQYNYAIYSNRLESKKDDIASAIKNFFEAVVWPKLSGIDVSSDFIIDFAVCNSDAPREDWKLWVIELNPFLSSTDGAMFSWEHERHILIGQEGFTFRTVNRVKPGSLSILPKSVRTMLKEC